MVGGGTKVSSSKIIDGEGMKGSGYSFCCFVNNDNSQKNIFFPKIGGPKGIQKCKKSNGSTKG